MGRRQRCDRLVRRASGGTRHTGNAVLAEKRYGIHAHGSAPPAHRRRTAADLHPHRDQLRKNREDCEIPFLRPQRLHRGKTDGTFRGTDRSGGQNGVGNVLRSGASLRRIFNGSLFYTQRQAGTAAAVPLCVLRQIHAETVSPGSRFCSRRRGGIQLRLSRPQRRQIVLPAAGVGRSGISPDQPQSGLPFSADRQRIIPDL